MNFIITINKDITMYQKIITTVCGLAMMFIAVCAFAQANDTSEPSSFYDNRALSSSDRPYQFYPDDADKAVKKTEDKRLPQNGEEAQAALEQLQQSVKLARSLALMNPTEANIKDYIRKQEVVMQTSATFSDVWRRAIWQNPELDYSQTHRPSDNSAIQAYDKSKDDRTKEIMANIAQTQGLLFFIRGDCNYCHTMAPIIKQFTDTYGIRIMMVSIDGGALPGFESVTVPDNGISQRLGVTVTPSLFLADTRNKRYMPIGSGVMSITELETRFVALLNTPGSSY